MISTAQVKKLNNTCENLKNAQLGTVIQNLEKKFTALNHTVVAGDVGATNTVVVLPFTGTPVGAVVTVVNNLNVEISGYTVALSENAVTITIVKASLPVDGKVYGIAW